MLLTLRDKLKKAEVKLQEADAAKTIAAKAQFEAAKEHASAEHFLNAALTAFKHDLEMKFDSFAQEEFLALIGHMKNETVGEQ
jgi:hypothetical protein